MGRNNPDRAKRQRKNKAQIVQYLRDKGIPPGVLQRAAAKNAKALCRDVMGVTDDEYRAAGGILDE